jgi:hypothetical protein
MSKEKRCEKLIVQERKSKAKTVLLSLSLADDEAFKREGQFVIQHLTVVLLSIPLTGASYR